MSDDLNTEKFNDKKHTQFGFSAISRDELDEDIYTLATVVVDISSSLDGQEPELERLLNVIVTRLARSSRSENILLRVIKFATDIHEVHGFIPVDKIDPSLYQNLKCYGWTALHDALYDSYSAIYNYAKQLITDGYDVNACVYICTDGEENRSSTNLGESVSLLKKITVSEEIESCVTALFGLNDPNASKSRQAGVKQYLENLVKEVGIETFVDAGDVNSDTIVKIGDIISDSISSQSDAIASGAPSTHIMPKKVF